MDEVKKTEAEVREEARRAWRKRLLGIGVGMKRVARRGVPRRGKGRRGR